MGIRNCSPTEDMSAREKLILAGLYLSKYDAAGLMKLGFDSFQEAFNVIGFALGAKPASIKNYRDEFAIAENLAKQDPNSAIWQNDAAWSRYCVVKVLIQIKDGDRNEARRLVMEGIDSMTRLEHQGALDTNAQDTLNKLNELATALTSSSRK